MALSWQPIRDKNSQEGLGPADDVEPPKLTDLDLVNCLRHDTSRIPKCAIRHALSRPATILAFEAAEASSRSSSRVALCTGDLNPQQADPPFLPFMSIVSNHLSFCPSFSLASPLPAGRLQSLIKMKTRRSATPQERF